MANFVSLWLHFIWSIFYGERSSPEAVGASAWQASWIVIHHWYGEPRTRAEALRLSKGEGYSDIPYNFLITREGFIWEGRPVGSCAANLGINSKSIAICFLGNFQVQQPTREQITAASGLIKSLLKTHTKARLILHRDVFKLVPLAYYAGRLVSTATKCPGDLFVRHNWGAVLWACVNGEPFEAARKRFK